MARATESGTKMIGTRFEATRTLDVAAVAKLVRADIKAAVGAGELPAGTYSVRIERYSMGQAINVWLSDLAGFGVKGTRVFDVEAMRRAARGEDVRLVKSDEMRAVLRKVEAIGEAYNRTEIDANADYHNVRFHLSVDVEMTWELARRAEERLAERETAQESWLAWLGAAA